MAESKPKTYFVTGVSGYVGGAVAEAALAAGFQVRALSRSDESDAKISALGATPVRGDITSLDVLSREAAASDGVLHLATAYSVVLSQGTAAAAPPPDAQAVETAAFDALAAPLAGTAKPLVLTTGTLVAAPDPQGGETDEAAPANPAMPLTRDRAETHGLAWAQKGVRVSCVRLAPWVYGRGGSGGKMFLGMAAQAGGAMVVAGGAPRTTAVHVDDAARLYLLAAAKAPPGGLYNASSETGVSFRQLAEAVAQALGSSVLELSQEQAQEKLGPFLAWFLTSPCRASGARARRDLGWTPRERGFLEEFEKGSYVAVAEAIKSGSA